jgi:hypothetical protein
MKFFRAILFLFLGCSPGYNPEKPGNTAPHDTIFLERTVSDTDHLGQAYPFYHAIYIEASSKSQYYSKLVDFSFTEYENLNDYNVEFKKRGIHLQKIKSGLPAEWLPLFQYKNKYYLYIPSDWGNTMRLMLTDSLLIYRGMELSASILNSVTQTDKYIYDLTVTDPYTGTEFVTIHIIDKKNKLAVWEFKNENKKVIRYALYVPKENAKDYDIIVNYCRTDKQSEFDFQEPDFTSLLKQNKHQ